MSGGIDGTDTEEHVVLTDIERNVRVGSDVASVRPKLVRRITPDNFIGRAGRREGGGFPGELSVVVEMASEDVDLLRLTGGSGESCQYSGVQPRDVRDIVGINELQQVPYSMPFSVRRVWCWWLKFSRHSVKRTAAKPALLKLVWSPPRR